jgi:hypothetical protein
MSLWEFLTWIWGEIGKATDWFSGSYWTWRGRLANFWDHLGSVYSDAVSYARWSFATLGQQVLGWINRSIDVVELRFGIDLSSLERRMSASLAIARVNLTSMINSVEVGLRSWVKPQIDAIYNWGHGYFEEISKLFTAQINTLKAMYSPLTALSGYVSRLVALVRDSMFSSLLDIVNRGYIELKLLFDNPTGYIMFRLEDSLLGLLDDVLGYGLGSTKLSLPDKRDWMGK